MKANRVAKSGLRDDRAEIGIGTLIVFIAAVLVAAVAAAVLINTSSQVQERAQQTGKEATQQVASNLYLVQVTASRPGTTGDMEHLNITVRPAAGAFPIDLGNTTILLRSNTTEKVLSYVNGAGADKKFNATAITDADGSFTAANPTVNGNDLAKIWINLRSTANNMPLAPNDRLSIKIVPPVGSPLLSDITMPTSFGVDTVVSVR